MKSKNRKGNINKFLRGSKKKKLAEKRGGTREKLPKVEVEKNSSGGDKESRVHLAKERKKGSVGSFGEEILRSIIKKTSSAGLTVERKKNRADSEAWGEKVHMNNRNNEGPTRGIQLRDVGRRRGGMQ